MTEVLDVEARPGAPAWMRPGLLDRVAYGVATLVFVGQIIAVLLRGSDVPTLLAVVVAGAGVAVSWRWPWPGLVIVSAASFAVTAVGQDPLSVWMMAVLVLFSFAYRGRQPLVGTLVVAGFFLAAFMTVGGFQGGAFAGAAALFSAIAGGASGAALRIYREHWLLMDERARQAVATRESEANRRVTEERLRIARDLHDIVGHQVAMLSVHLGVAEIGLPDDAESSRQALVAARSSARNVVVETQQILAVLRRGDQGRGDQPRGDQGQGDPTHEEDALRPTPALGGLDALITSFASIGLEVHSTIEIRPETAAPGVGVAVYRVVQESLTNAYRHGEGAATVVVLEEPGGGIHITVENQISRAPREFLRGSGLGLVGMRERIESSGGHLTVDSQDGRFRVRADFSPVAAVFR